ncbi:DUF4145 domain-containing protein [Lichenihabitans sp. Uapishka_5]|uniref:DUF4145 domain-containing protein n=1 Tax=Lichenihabitans sp. Uapishka_5 TaxID=3037302 RepID=UPI0029E7DF18|nr:DUF4145 domain-containing protein [Lichenihabitans sp. Uapishka_5]MDX7953742.1 DUF4145 domain-containing protein [Lichenihabitans sp. Uapishka_5]
MGILVHTCPHCRTERIALEIGGETVQGATEYSRNAFLNCPKCKQPSCAVFSVIVRKPFGVVGQQSNNPAHNMDLMRRAVNQQGVPANGDPTDQNWDLTSLWPEVPKPRLPDSLPDEVAKAFLAGERNYPQENMEEAAAGSYRRALDVGTKHLANEMPDADDFARQQLNNRIEMLRARGRLTQDLADWSHQIKGLGNEAMHAMDGITREELTALRGFTELVLTYLFTLPGMLAARKADADKAKC